jgi:hypothetical protein
MSPANSSQARDARARRMGLIPGPSCPTPSSPHDVQVIRELSVGATTTHNFAAPRPPPRSGEFSEVTYQYLCDGRALGHDGSAILADCLSKLLSNNDTVANSQVDNLKERVEIALRTLNWKQKDARPVYVDWIERSMGKGAGKSQGTLTIRLGGDSGTFGTALLTGTPQARLLRAWEQSVADGAAEARWSLAAASHESTPGEQEGSSSTGGRISTTSSAPIDVSEAPNPVARGTLRRSTRIATS